MLEGGGQPTYGKFHRFRLFFFESFPKVVGSLYHENEENFFPTVLRLITCPNEQKECCLVLVSKWKTFVAKLYWTIIYKI